ncbi:hypothetical protein NC652_012151 [Populus alba x Populus x berolinensis]|uniref:TF-B3 domain-containing protein n=1 Tax=Populus alba x Populus x berolinensis TaxID=444605 RepID=A0AAD6R493_9ROSI|nr:hypothetical protein NC652_012151 [Populus alba x Populus x berolinensis]KAJ7002098.1 hypothetical protein NC653_012229 [Populus alba x Populus x berolinensis]
MFKSEVRNSRTSQIRYILLQIHTTPDLPKFFFVFLKQAMALVFSKFLTADDIENGLCIPGCSLDPLPFEEGQSMNMHVQDGNGQEWIFSCTIRRNQSMGHFLSVGWNKFVRERDLRVDDKVTIHEEAMKNQATGTCIKVEVKRKIRLFGEDVWAAV